jgi:hypothetical protein
MYTTYIHSHPMHMSERDSAKMNLKTIVYIMYSKKLCDPITNFGIIYSKKLCYLITNFGITLVRNFGILS